MSDRVNTSTAIVIPREADMAGTAEILKREAVPFIPCGDVVDMCRLAFEDVGCAVIVEEALSQDNILVLQNWLQCQPAWSDLPIILIGSGSARELESIAGTLFPKSGNLTILSRPLSPLTLVSAIRVAIRSRGKQLEVRDLLEAQRTSLRQRDEFLAMLAHELRNPLAPIRNAVHVLKQFKYDDAMFVKVRELIDRQTTHLAKLVDDLLDVARLEKGKVELAMKIVSLNDCIASACEAIAVTAAQKRQKLSTELSKPLYVCADVTRFDQIISNLLTNACKFTPEGGAIQVRAFEREGKAVVQVQDSGIGLEPQQIDSVFDLFTQGSGSIARSAGGMGIGLTIVRRLVKLHGGTVVARSNGKDQGTLFEIALPLVDYLPLSSLADAPATSRNGHLNILLIEDNADIRESLTILLELWGHRVTTAADGAEGVDTALKGRFDVAIVDIGLPILDGFEVAKKLRAELKSTIRLVALTGYGQQQDLKRSKEVGFDEHLLKPVDPTVLSEKLALVQ